MIIIMKSAAPVETGAGDGTFILKSGTVARTSSATTAARAGEPNRPLHVLSGRRGPGHAPMLTNHYSLLMSRYALLITPQSLCSQTSSGCTRALFPRVRTVGVGMGSQSCAGTVG